MGPRKQTYKKEWEKEKDGTELAGKQTLIGDWCTQEDTFTARCRVCLAPQNSLNVGSMGKGAILQHAKKDKHQKAFKLSRESNISSFAKRVEPEQRDNTVKADIKWALFCAENDLPLAISDAAGKTFASMFPDSKIASQFSSARTKTSYQVTDGLGPTLHETLVKKMQENKFSVLIDESNKLQGTKYLHILVKFVDQDQLSQTTAFYKAVVVNEATAENIVNAMKEAFVKDHISWDNVLQIMSDSPAVMRGRLNGVIARIKRTLAPNILDYGGCSLHHIHNAVSYGTDAFGEEIEEFAVDLFAFFKHRSGLQDEYKGVQVLLEAEEHKLLRFVSTRWLSLLPVVQRILEQWEVLKRFFGDLPNKHPEVCKQERAKKIKQHLDSDETLLKLNFLSSVLPIFQQFEKLFQAQDTQIHILHLEMVQLMQKVLAQFVKPEKLEGKSAGADLVGIDYKNVSNQLDSHKLAVGRAASIGLQKVTHETKKRFHMAVRKFYTTVTEKLFHYLPLDDPLLKDLVFLCPASQKLDGSRRKVVRVATSLAKVEPSIKVDQVEAEWRAYAIDRDYTSSLPDEKVSTYWSSVLQEQLPSGHPKYPQLKEVVKCCLSLAHGNADTERTFSQTAKILTKHRNQMGIEMLNGLMTIKTHLKCTGQTSDTFVITEPVIKACQSARTNYEKRIAAAQKTDLELRKKKKQEEEERVLMDRLTEEMKLSMEKSKAATKEMDALQKH